MNIRRKRGSPHSKPEASEPFVESRRRSGSCRIYERPSCLIPVQSCDPQGRDALGGRVIGVMDQVIATVPVAQHGRMARPSKPIAARRIRLDQDVKVTGLTRRDGGFSITAVDGRGQAEGKLILEFNDNPISLAGWTVIDAQGLQTKVRLSGLAAASGFTHCEVSASGMSRRLAGVSRVVGRTALTRTRRSRSSSARLMVRAITPALDAA